MKMGFELKWVAVNSNELKLWENDGTGLKIISRCFPGHFSKKKNGPHSYQHSWEYGKMPSLLSANGQEEGLHEHLFDKDLEQLEL